jgi:hypothetical protein
MFQVPRKHIALFRPEISKLLCAEDLFRSLDAFDATGIIHHRTLNRIENCNIDLVSLNQLTLIELKENWENGRG